MPLRGLERETAPVAEKPTTPEISAELGDVESVPGAEISLPQPITDDKGRVLLAPSTPPKVAVTLPLTEEELNQKAPSLKIIDSFRWLKKWARRALGIVGGGFKYGTC